MNDRYPGLPDEPFWNIPRVVSVSIAGLYVVTGLLLLGPADAFEILMSSALPLMLIWLPDVMGEQTGWTWLYGMRAAGTTPAGIVKVVGWILLLLPAVLLTVALRGSGAS